MFKRMLVGSLIGMLVLTAALTGAAQDMTEPQLFLTFKDEVKLTSVVQYMEGIKKFIAVYNENDMPWEVQVYSEPGIFYGVVLIDSFTDLDKGEEIFEGLKENVGEEKWNAMEKELQSAVQTSSSSCSVYRPDLSYLAEDGFFKWDPSESHILVVTDYCVKPGMEKEFEQLSRDYAELCREKGSKLTYLTHQVIFGEDLPIFRSIVPAKDLTQFLAESKKHGELLSEDLPELMKKGSKLLRRMERKMNIQYHPDLSYFPQDN